MTATVKFSPNTSVYEEVVSGTTNDFLLTVNNGTAEVIFADTIPTGHGHRLPEHSGLVRGGLTGKVWAKGVGKPVNIVVTEEV